MNSVAIEIIIMTKCSQIVMKSVTAFSIIVNKVRAFKASCFSSVHLQYSTVSLYTILQITMVVHGFH